MDAADGGGEGFEVMTEAMDQASRNVAELVGRIQDALGQLDQRMSALFGTWDGDAMSAYRDLHSGWQADYRDLNEKLRAIGEGLAASSGTYVQADVASTPGAGVAG